MKIVISLAFEEGDVSAPVALHFADGSEVTLTPENATAHVDPSLFEAIVNPEGETQ